MANGILSSFFGSDVYEAYTSAYTWQTNQMAHAMMGFAGTTLLSIAASVVGLDPVYGAVFVVIPIAKDFTDLVLDDARAHAAGRGAFKARLRELVFDAVTDSFFWSLGALLSLTVVLAGQYPQAHPSTSVFLWTFIAAFALALSVPGRYYLREKRSFDRTRLPYYYRLPNFDGAFADPSSADKVLGFMDTAAERSHLVVFGPRGARKTTLAVGIGSGMTINRRPVKPIPTVRYISAAQLLDELNDPAATTTTDKDPYPVFEADVLIIDDLSMAVLSALGAIGDNTSGTVDELAPLLDKSVVWVLARNNEAQEWFAWLKRHTTKRISVDPVELLAPGTAPGRSQFSIFRGQWQGVFPLISVTLAISLVVASIWVLTREPVPTNPVLFFAAAGFGVALIAEIALLVLGKRVLSKSRR